MINWKVRIRQKWFWAAVTPAVLLLLDQLYRDSFTKDILLACFCADEALCHRSILAGLLAGVGADIDCGAGYLKYFGMLQETLSGKD